jgi:DNA-nicking Smr family endonuclease
MPIRADRVPPKVPVENDAYQAQSLGGHRAVHARRGRLEPQARLDLHGLTREKAFRALVVFLRKAQMQDLRLVLVITGKSGVLRESVPRWLAQGEAAELNSGVSSAHIRHGGEGALYIGIKAAKARKP